MWVSGRNNLCRPPPSFPRKRESSASAWIPGLRFTPPGMTGVGLLVTGRYQRMSFPSIVIPANAGIQFLGLDSGSPFHSVWNDGGGVVGIRSLPANVVPLRHSRESGNPQCLGQDSGSSFHCARNDGGVGLLVSGRSQRMSSPSVIPAKAGIECLGLDSGSLFHSARNDGGGVVGNRSLPANVVPLRHSRESGNPVPRPEFRASVSLRAE